MRISGAVGSLLNRSSALALGVALSIGGPSSVALAQAATAPPKDTPKGDAAASSLGEVVVTGSRVLSAFNAPTPVNVVGEQRLERTGVASIGDALDQMPSFRPITTPSSNLYRMSTNTAARSLDLRGLGDSRTLVLVDGRRFVPSSELGTVDLNAIPSSLISRAEVVTGGASAAYGANAVAGVVNLILDTKLTGLRAEASYGETQKGDAQTYYISAAGGADFAGGRGHVIAGGEYVDEHPAGDCFTRSWCSPSIGLIPNPGFSTNPARSNGLPAILLLNNVWSILNPGGVIASGLLKGTTFDSRGMPAPFQFGSLVSGTSMVGGDPSVGRSLLTEHVPLKTANRHYALFGHATYDLTDRIQGVAELSYSDVRGGPTQGSNVYDFSSADTSFAGGVASGGSGLRIKLDNAYLPAATRNAMIAAGVTTIPISELYQQLTPPTGTSDSKTFRAMLGVSGDVLGGWKWDGYYQYGQTTSRLDIVGLRKSALFAQAADAVASPSGSIVCRSTLTNPTNGCVPFDVFGPGNASSAAVAYVTGDGWATRDITQHVVAANLRGVLFNTWAGPVGASAGLEYRQDRSQGGADATSIASGWNSNNAYPLPAGGSNTSEAYAEVNVPLMKDTPWGKSLNIDGAVRETYSENVGDSKTRNTATTWKAGAVYYLNDEYMLRVTRSHDIRVPSALELSPISNTVNLPVNDPNPATAGTYYVSLTSGGNPRLQPEDANTTTVGAVLRPNWLKKFSFSVDYYNISVGQAIAVLTGQQTVNVCAAGDAAVCPFIIRNTAGQITQVISTYQNLSVLHSEGLEFVAQYSVDLHDVWSPLRGNLDVVANATNTFGLSTTDATGFVTNYNGWTGNPGTIQSIFGVPKWRVDGLVTYSTDRYAFSAHARYVGPGVYDQTKIGPGQPGYSPYLANSNNYNLVDSRLYWDLSGSFDVVRDGKRTVELFGSIYNLLDQAPPRERLYGNPILFDGLGRSFRLGIRMRM